MTIEQFGSKVCGALKKVMETECEIEFREVKKNNGICLHGIVITVKGSNISPAIYIDELFEEYEDGRTLGDIVYDILCVYKRYAKDANINMDFFTQFEQAKSKILYKLVHADSNKELLDDVPYVKWNDLALVFYYALEDERIGRATILIRNTHLQMWGIEMPVLYETAKKNMLRLCPEEMMPIKELIREYAQKSLSGMEKDGFMDLPENFHEAMAQDSAMYVLSNRGRIFGAAALLYSESIKRLTKRLNKNLVILPSSVHEVLLIPDDGITKKEFFMEMVKEVNDTQVEPEERLSYNIYYYDRVSGKISIWK